MVQSLSTAGPTRTTPNGLRISAPYRLIRTQSACGLRLIILVVVWREKGFRNVFTIKFQSSYVRTRVHDSLFRGKYWNRNLCWVHPNTSFLIYKVEKSVRGLRDFIYGNPKTQLSRLYRWPQKYTVISNVSFNYKTFCYKNHRKIKQLIKNCYVHWTKLKVCREYEEKSQSPVRKGEKLLS